MATSNLWLRIQLKMKRTDEQNAYKIKVTYSTTVEHYKN